MGFSDFVLVDNGQVRAKLEKAEKLKAQFDAFLTERDLQLTIAQRKLSDVVLQATAGDSQLMQLLTTPAAGLSFALSALDSFGDESKRQWWALRFDSERSAPLRAPYLVGDYIIQT